MHTEINFEQGRFMNITKYVAAVAFLTVLSNSPVVFGQTVVLPSRTAIATPVATPVAAPIAAPVATPFTGSINNGDGYYKANDKGREAKEEHFVMSGTIAGNILNVVSITSGRLRVGSKLSGDGIPRGTTIIAFGTGRGGVGTYTIATSPSDD